MNKKSAVQKISVQQIFLHKYINRKILDIFGVSASVSLMRFFLYLRK